MIKMTAEDLEYITSIATLNKFEVNALLAIIEIESGGVIFTSTGLPVIRWEGHYFDRLVPADKRDLARKQGLASPNVGGIRNPSSQTKRYDILARAAAIDPFAAYSSISIGVGQVMGANYKDLGYSSPEAMFKRASQGLQGQVDLMVKFIKANNLVDEIQRKDWSAFARAYNGPAYRKNRYHLNMEEAYNRYNGNSVVTTTPASNNMLRLGSQGAKVREVQQLLNRAGFVVKVDGDFGPSTKEAVKAFQKKYKLQVDGIIGPKTQAQLLTWLTSSTEQPGQPKPSEIPDVKNAAGLGVIGVFLLALHQFTDRFFSGPVMWIGFFIAIVAGMWAWDAYQKAKKTYEGTK